MIARLWSGAVRQEDGERYLEYLEETGIAEYRSTEGNRGVMVLRRDRGGRMEFLLISLWDSMEAVRRFAGPEPERAVFYPEDDRFLVQRAETVEHYDVAVRG